MGNTSGIKWNGINNAGTLQSSYEIILRDTKTNNEEKILLPDFFDQAITLGFISTNSGWSLTGNAGTYPTVNFLGTTNGKNLIIQPDSGNVGIGTTTPAFKLDVLGSFNILDENGGDSNLIIADIAGAGLFGIQTILASNDTKNTIELDGSLELKTEDTALGLITRIDLTKEQTIIFSTSSNDVAIIDATGNVGIGTATPTVKLNVVGQTLLESADQTGVYYKGEFQDANIDIKVVNDVNNDQAIISIGNSGSPQTAMAVGFNTNDIHTILVDDQSPIKVTSTNAPSVVLQALTTGEVGIGTATPASKLTVDGGDIEVIGDTNGLILESPNNTRYRITVANGGTLTVTAV